MKLLPVLYKSQPLQVRVSTRVYTFHYHLYSRVVGES